MRRFPWAMILLSACFYASVCAAAARENGLGPEKVARSLACGTKGRCLKGVLPEMDILGEPSAVMQGSAVEVRVRWEQVKFTSKHDWVGVFPCRVGESTDECSPLDRYPVQYKPTPNGKTLDGEQELVFRMIVRPGVWAYRVAYITAEVAPYPEVATMTPPIVIPEKLVNSPSQVRVSLVSGDPSAMRFMWSERSGSQSPTDVTVAVREERDGPVVLASDPSSVRTWSYSRQDLCERTLMPAGSVGWIPPALQVETVVRGFKANHKYWYSIRRNGTESSMHELRTGPGAGAFPTKMVVFGDMGQTMDGIDSSMQHSWDFKGRGEISAPNTTRLVDQLVREKGATLVAHIGDISYATGALALWDTFLVQVERVSSLVAYMTAIGNHEMGWGQSAIPGSDSQGECGRPYCTFFPFASQAMQSGVQPWDAPWYTFEHGAACVVVMSTEHDFSRGSPQRLWLENALRTVNRTRTPWLLLMGHRPMYVSSNFKDDHDIAAVMLQTEVQPLLVQANVDIAFWGHHHSYQRSRVIQGVQHIVVGTGGFGFSGIKPGSPDPDFLVAMNTTWGVSSLELVNATHAHLQFLSNLDGSVKDHHVVIRDRTSARDFISVREPLLFD